MRLAVSALALRSFDQRSMLRTLRDLGAEGIEVVPSLWWDDVRAVTDENARDARKLVMRAGLEVSGIQSLFFGRPDLQLLDPTTWPDLRDHLVRMIRLAALLGADVAVLGSPANRRRGVLTREAALDRAATILGSLVPALEQHDVVLTVEPNAPAYGADFVTDYAEACRLTDAVGSRHVMPQIDTGCFEMVKDDPLAAVDAQLPWHVHMSAPHLRPPHWQEADLDLIERLADRSYSGWVVLEMLGEQDAKEPDPAIRSFVTLMRTRIDGRDSRTNGGGTTTLSPRTSDHVVIIPVIDEGERLIGQLREIRNERAPIDVVIADGGSVDGSTDPRLLSSLGVHCLVRHSDGGGVSAQLRKAFIHTLDEGYSGFITMDGNGKDGAEGIMRISDALARGADFVQGSRWIDGGSAINTPIHRTLAARFVHAPVTSLAAGRRYTDSTNGFRGHSRRLLTDRRIQALRDSFTGYELLAYLPIAAARAGLRTEEVPVSRSYPDRGPTPTRITGFRHHLQLLRILLTAATGGYGPHSHPNEGHGSESQPLNPS